MSHPAHNVSLCDKYDALLMVDEAHSLGVLGTRAGIQEYFGLHPDAIDIKMGTLSKSDRKLGALRRTGRRSLDDFDSVPI